MVTGHDLATGHLSEEPRGMKEEAAALSPVSGGAVPREGQELCPAISLRFKVSHLFTHKSHYRARQKEKVHNEF